MIIAIRGLCIAQSPIFLYVCPKTLLQTNPTTNNTLLPQKGKTIQSRINHLMQKRELSECGRHSKARLTMLRNSNFQPVFQNIPHFYHNTSSVLYPATRSSTNTHKPNTDSYKFIYKNPTPLTAGKTNRKNRLLYAQQNQVINLNLITIQRTRDSNISDKSSMFVQIRKSHAVKIHLTRSYKYQLKRPTRQSIAAKSKTTTHFKPPQLAKAPTVNQQP